MDAIFIELPPFERHRATHFTDDDFKNFQVFLLQNPTSGDVIQNTGGLRKVRFVDPRRNKGKRGGVRVIYYWWLENAAFLLFTVYDKDQQHDLAMKQKEALHTMLNIVKKGGIL